MLSSSCAIGWACSECFLLNFVVLPSWVSLPTSCVCVPCLCAISISLTWILLAYLLCRCPCVSLLLLACVWSYFGCWFWISLPLVGPVLALTSCRLVSYLLLNESLQTMSRSMLRFVHFSFLLSFLLLLYCFLMFVSKFSFDPRWANSLRFIKSK